MNGGLSQQSQTELLAPAGGPDAGYAALQYGADAVYLGLNRFSARADAVNFSLDELDDFTGYAHSLPRPRRVYAAMNTLVFETETAESLDALAAVRDIGIDAIIVQDVGLADLARRFFPDLRLHASTQMAIHDLAGVKTLERLGFKRVTLARELTLEEIRGIISESTIEIETFIHGALCYSYSGLCLYSAMLRGRSGNRGGCAYACRDSFHKPGESGLLPFSMKDAAFDEFAVALADSGVSSLKIEGRKKSALYVAAVVNYYRKKLNGLLTPAEADILKSDIRTIFSRQWTSLFLDGTANDQVIDKDITGHRGEPIGTVRTIIRRNDGHSLIFRSNRVVELHDGLQFDTPRMKRPFGFGVESIRVLERPDPPVGRNAVSAPSGSWLEIPLPDDRPKIETGATVYLSSSGEVKRKYAFDKPKPGAYKTKVPINVRVHLAADGVRLDASVVSQPNEKTVSVQTIQPATLDAARQPALTADAVDKAVRRTGDTRFAVQDVALDDPDQRMAPASILNSARRELTAKLEAEFLSVAADRKNDLRRRADALLPEPTASSASFSDAVWAMKFDDSSIAVRLPESILNGLDDLIIDIGSSYPADSLIDDMKALMERLGAARLRAALPVVSRGARKKAVNKRVAALIQAGVNRWQISNLSGWEILKQPIASNGPLDISGDWPLYSMNSQAVRAWLERGLSSVTLSPEDSLLNMSSLLKRHSGRITTVAYQDTPLFISAVCAKAGLAGGCLSPGGQCKPSDWTLANDRKNEAIRIRTRDCETVVVNETPLCYSGRLKELASAGAQRFRADFIIRQYDSDKIASIWESLRADRAIDGTTSGGLDRRPVDPVADA